MAKRLLVLLLALLCVLPALAESPDEVYAISDAQEEWENPIDPGRSPSFVPLLLEVARGELGYREGPNNHTKYGLWSGDANAAWCAEFVCWCVNQVDEIHGTSLLNDVYPNWGGQNVGRDWFIKHGRFVYRKGFCPNWGYQWLKGDDHHLTKGEYIPHPGDVVFFSYNEAGDTEHAALVEYCAYNSEGDVIIHVIEGNNPSTVQRNRYLLSNSQILGFGLCEDLVDTTMRSGNSGVKVTALQEALCRVGVLDERHITGSYGGNTKQAVMDFQSTHMQDKAATGIADRETQQALEALFVETVYEDPETWLVE